MRLRTLVQYERVTLPGGNMKRQFRVSTATYAAFCCFLIVGLLAVYLKVGLLKHEWLGIARFLETPGIDRIPPALTRLGFYFNDIVICLILLPLVGTTLVTMVFRRYRVGAAVALSVLASLFLFFELRAQAVLGQYVSRSFLLDSIRFGTANPGVAGQYATPASLIKLAILFVLCLTIWVIARVARCRERANGAHNIPAFRWLLKLPACAVWACAILIAPLSFAQQLPDSPWNASSLTHVTRALFESGTGSVAGMDFGQAFAALRKLSQVPPTNPTNPLAGKERGANVLLFSMETGPARALDFADSGNSLPGAGPLLTRAFVARRHYTTYPYTSNAIYSIMSGMYPHGRGRLTTAAQTSSVNGLMNAMKADVRIRRVYLPSPGTIQSEGPMLETFGADAVYASDQHPDDPMRIVAQRRTDALIAGLEQNGSTFGKSARKQLRAHLLTDFQALEKMKSDITAAAHAHERFAVAFQPEIGHAPWLALHNEETIIARGRNLMLLQDQWLKELVDLLDELGELDHTVIVFTGDHGIRTRIEDSALPTGKISEYMFRVPLLIYAPRALQGTTYIDAPSSHIDIAPTILTLLGYTPSANRMVGIPVWQRRPEHRLYFWAAAYGGADGFEEAGMYYMRQAMSGHVFRGTYADFSNGFLDSTAIPRNTETARFVQQALSEASALQETVVTNWIEKQRSNLR